MRYVLIALLILAAWPALAGVHHRHRHDCGNCNSITEYRGYYRNSDGNVWEGDVEPGYGEERYGENGGTTHYGY